ncbi:MULTISPECIES: dTDP-4-dehydrorhamnose reductase [Haloarcula]|uniref:NAD(P)-dependent oxidoreductase n=1 Tax=Haloarcula pellucida TaxID=1427151 RepID=A0A830GKG7_9EURY|nr:MULTISPECIES: dTDP-4-dehydrorhamnose reductase [Halomicroarcula]MBX0348741.1 dTDP-4-dehydrorhamnose reductase [Halomicroarcula pellucida]MDS0278509.1 dTDP-4-dehydrorhamnose reductase [Halomicroarcula sp. S1AR25-4]GGN91993.1 NAD(P)-dependent oxidoreductase [Halomicroarcula pellucida]
MSNQRVLVVGASGLVGTNVVQDCRARGVDVTGTYRSEQTATADVELDKTDEEQARSVFESVDPDAVVDTAAFHAVDDCETNRAKAWEVNAEGTFTLAALANEFDAHYLYVSSDYVFAGNSDETPYRESDAVAPLNYYAETKYAAERAARVAERATIVRPSVIYGLESANFVTWALGELESGNAIDIVDDQVSAPTYAPNLARASVDLVTEGETGLYHATGPTSIDRYEFTQRLAEVFGYDTDLVRPISTEEFGQEAPRPTDSTLDSAALYEWLEWEFDTPKEAFESMQSAR